MSLLIKALDKAQGAKQDAKNKQAEADAEKQTPSNKPQAKRAKAPDLALTDIELTIADAGEELSPAPASSAVSPSSTSLKESALDTLEFDANLIPASIRNSAVGGEITGYSKPRSAAATQFEPAIALATPVDSPRQTQTARKAPAPPLARAQEKETPQKETPEKVNQAQAAKVFVANKAASSGNNTLAIIAGGALIALLGIGGYFYYLLNATPTVTMPPAPPVATAPASPINPVPASIEMGTPELPTTQAPAAPEITAQALPEPEAKPASATEIFEAREPIQAAETPKRKAAKNAQMFDDVPVENTLDPNETLANDPGVKPPRSKAKLATMANAIASESASIQVSQSKPQNGVNPTLMQAYNAYNAANLSEAQKLYKQVLQQDNNNVDAMLGLGAIAAQQDRAADANGWYRKVLSVEPRNSTALAAMLDAQQQETPQTSEREIKSMLAKAPNDADLHAALGNAYAEQNQWPAAQQAYFDAFRLNESAENAFNLAVSLDQMGKPKLALPYYQQALQMAQQTSARGIDKAALEARIAAIK